MLLPVHSCNGFSSRVSCLSCSRFSTCFGVSPHGAYVCVQPAVHAGLGSRPFSVSCRGTQHITGTASNEATSDVGSRSWPLRCTCSTQICDIIHRVCCALLNLSNIIAVQFRMNHLSDHVIFEATAFASAHSCAHVVHISYRRGCASKVVGSIDGPRSQLVSRL